VSVSPRGQYRRILHYVRARPRLNVLAAQRPQEALHLLIRLKLGADFLKQTETGARVLRRDARARQKQLRCRFRAVFDEKLHGATHQRLDLLALAQERFGRDAIFQKRRVVGKLQPFGHQVRQSANIRFRPVEGRDHSQHVYYRALCVHAPEDVQAGWNQALFNLKHLFKKGQHPAVSVFARHKN
jgi:hypothetical protein